MATQLYQFAFDSGRRVVVEVDNDRPVGGRAVTAGFHVSDAKQSIKDLLGVVPEILGSLYQGIAIHTPSPHEIKLEMGVKLSGELGLIVAKTHGEGNIKITATWKNE